MSCLQAIGLAALIYNERWQEVRQELQWSPDIFRSFRLRQGEHVDTVFHLLCSKGAKCPLDLLEGVLNIAPELIQVDSESLLQSLLQNKMWEIILIILRCYPDVIRTTLFPTRQGYLVTILHVLCHRQAHGECPPLTVVDGVIAAAPESLQWKGPGIPLHYAVQSCCTRPTYSERYKWLVLVDKLLEAYPEGVAVRTLATPAPSPAAAPAVQQPQQQQAASNGCTPLSLAVSLGACPDTVRRLLKACPERLLSEAGVHESFLNVAYDSTLYVGRKHHRSAVFDMLRPAHHVPAAALLSIVPIVVAVATVVARPRYARTSLGAIMLFNVLHGPDRILDWWEQRGRRPIAARLEPIDLVAITSPGLSLKFHNEQQAAHTLHPAITSPTYKSTTTNMTSEKKKNDELASNTPDACVVCWEGMADHVLIPCGHVCLCLSCSKLLRTTLRSKCPVCNGIVQQALKIFGAGIATK